MHTQEARPSQNDNSLALALVLQVEVRVLHRAYARERGEQDDDRDDVEPLLRFDVRRVDRRSDWRPHLERERVGQRRHDVRNERERVRGEVRREARGE